MAGSLGTPIVLYVYDLSHGMASQFSGLVGFTLEGIWHTAVVAFGKEWFFGGGGIEHCQPGKTMLGEPLRKFNMGETTLSYSEFRNYLDQLGHDRYAGHRYHLLDHNCNHFSNEVCLHLTKMPIPQSILDLPIRVKNSPVAAMLMPIMESATPRGENMEQLDREEAKWKHFPHTDYIIFDQKIDAEKFMGRVECIIKENGDKTGEISQDISDSLTYLIKDDSTLDDKHWSVLKAPLTLWSPENLFPILDALRYVTSQNAVKMVPDAVDGVFLILESILKSPLKTNIQLSLKILCNLFAFAKTRGKLMSNREVVVANINTLIEQEEEPLPNILQISLCSLAFNYAIVYLANPDEEASFQIVSALISNYFVTLTSHEALYRAVVALGTLVIKNAEAKELALALDARIALAKVKTGESTKLKEAVEECKRALE